MLHRFLFLSLWLFIIAMITGAVIIVHTCHKQFSHYTY
jgi:hypothetical protein